MTNDDRIDLSGHAAIVTGATSGIGRRFAVILAARGARVVAIGRDRGKLDQLANEISATGGTAYAMTADLEKADTLGTVVEEASRAAGRITLLVNAAGVLNPGSARKVPLDLVDQTLAVNLRAPFILSREVAGRLIEAGTPGRIVNVASMAAFSLLAGGTAIYAAAKAGLVRLTEALALEWAPYHINVNAIAPGTFSTQMTAELVRKIGDGFVERFPRKRMGDVSQLDSSLMFLVSPASEFVTGTVLKVDDAQFGR